MTQPPPAATPLRFSAVLLSWKRQHNLPAILESLRRIPDIGEIVIWNNNPEETLRFEGVKVINSSENYYCFSRYCLAPLLEHEHVWFQDDDLSVSPEQFEALLGHYRRDPTRIYGCRGRNLIDGRYNGDDAQDEVDIVLGQTMMFHRRETARLLAAAARLPRITEDDIAFSLSFRRRHFVVDVGPVRDLGSQDSEAACLRPGHWERRQQAVDLFRRVFAQPPAAQALAAAQQKLDAVARDYEALKGSAGVRFIGSLKRLPALYPAYRRAKALLRLALRS